MLSKNEYIVDRLEEDFIIIIDSLGNTISIKKDKILTKVKEGDIITKFNNKYCILKQETSNIKKGIENKLKGMWDE